MRLRGLLGRFLDLVGRVPDALARGLRGLLRDLPAVLERLLRGVLGLLLYLVRDWAEPLILHARGGHEHPREEPGRGRADREPERVLLPDADCPATDVLDVV